MNIEYTILPFDTKLFGFNVAKILSPRLESIELQKLLMQLAAQDVRLVYWQADSVDEVTQQAAKQCQGFLGSQQITYAINLQDLPNHPIIHEDVEIYQEHEVTSDLENLALQAGTYSHFRIDPKFPYNLFVKLFNKWIYNSLNGEIADNVMVVKRGNKIAGMLTNAKKNGRGDIGLLAVYAEYRGQDIGTHLVRAAQRYWYDSGLTAGQVVTQVANKAARGLYEKCGFKPEKIENFYHFWL